MANAQKTDGNIESKYQQRHGLIRITINLYGQLICSRLYRGDSMKTLDTLYGKTEKRDKARRKEERLVSILGFAFLAIGVLVVEFSIYQLLQFMGS